MQFRLTSILSFLAGAMLLAASCNKGAEPTYNDRPVVTAYLNAGAHPLITVSRQASTSSEVVSSSENINTLTLILSDGNNNYSLSPMDSGRYTEPTLFLEAGKTYSLSFTYNGKTVSASTTIPAKPQGFTESVSEIQVQKIDSTTVFGPGSGFTMPDPIDLTWANNDNSYYVVVTQNLEAAPELIRDTLASGSNRPAFNFRNQPSISSSARINAMQFQYFGKHRIVLYKLLPDYAALYESVNNSSTSLTTAGSNITNGFGIFTGINSDTLYLQVDKK